MDQVCKCMDQVIYLIILPIHDMGLNARKPVFGGLRTTQAQTSLRIRADWSAPLFFAYPEVSYLDLLRLIFQFLASLCSLGDWFETCFVGNPEDRFSRGEAHIERKAMSFETYKFIILQDVTF